MTFKKTLLALTTGVTLLASAVAASAAPASATNALNVRSGPGTGYRVVDVLYAGERVEVENCRSNGWCFISHRGSDGWVSARYLTNAPAYRERHRSYSRYPVRPQPPVYYRNYGGSGTSFSFSFGFGTDNDRDCFRRHGRVICR